MRICVLIPHEDQIQQAGVRIRYLRMQPAFQALGHDLRVMHIEALAEEGEHSDDCYIISKCYDARACIAAHLVKSRGKLLGVDLFDDYFFDDWDSRLSLVRAWLATMAEFADFFLCSTLAMQTTARRFAPGLPTHVMNDPAEQIDADAIASAALAKVERARRTGVMRIGWFGTGDNLYFQVGLSDLAAFSHHLRALAGGSMRLHLDILTNVRALSSSTFSMLNRIGVPFTVEEWSVELEQALLAQSMVCFLPVNAQPFSTAKSLNRAITALTSGCQVLSAGFPLYEALAPFIYRDAGILMRDHGAGRLAVRPDTAAHLAERLSLVADSSNEAEGFAGFLRQVGQPSKAGNAASHDGLGAVVHGVETNANIHKMAQRYGLLSVAGPHTPNKLNCDLRFQVDGMGNLTARASTTCYFRFRHVLSRLTVADQTAEPNTVLLDLSGLAAPQAAVLLLAADKSPFASLAAQSFVNRGIEDILKQLFPGIACYASETSRMPVWLRPPIRSMPAAA